MRWTRPHVSVLTFLGPHLRLLHQGYADSSSSVAMTAGCMDAATQMVVSTTWPRWRLSIVGVTSICAESLVTKDESRAEPIIPSVIHSLWCVIARSCMSYSVNYINKLHRFSGNHICIHPYKRIFSPCTLHGKLLQRRYYLHQASSRVRVLTQIPRRKKCAWAIW